MTTAPATSSIVSEIGSDRGRTHRLAVAGAAIGSVGAVAEAVSGGFYNTTPGTGPYQYAADYWLTAAALPHAVGAMLLMVAVHQLQGSRDGRLGRSGLVLNGLSLTALSLVIAWSLTVGHEIQAGPTYILGTLGTFVATALFAAGSWRTGLLPRWMLAIWPFVWVMGSFAAVSASPLLLVVFYVVLLLVLRRRVG